jgi:serine/threonine protein kinase
MGRMQLKPTMRHAKQSNGTAVIVKLLRPSSDELWILQHLHLIKSQINPTIPLLGALELNVGTFVFLLKATPLDLQIELKISISQSKVVDLSSQLIKGVGFLHDHGIAHLDIKPQNIVVLRNRLFIIDFDISVCVDGPEALIDRRCGTPQWMAPEIGHQNGLYSPIRADLWSCGRVLQYLADEVAVKENPFEELTWLLLSKDPRDRPLLHLLGSDTVEHLLSESQAGLKRKAEAEALPPYAKRLATGTVYT